LEAQAFFAPFGWCEIGPLVSAMRAGAELRCAVMDEDLGHPLSIALSGGVFDQWGKADQGHELRAGLDLSMRVGWATPLLNIYIASVPNRWEVRQHAPFEKRLDGAPDSVSVIRDEVVLSIPLGLGFGGQGRSESDMRGRVIVGVVPGITLSADPRGSPAYEGRDAVTVVSVEQHWSLLFTAGVQLEL
jgi:hypothetical protein